MYKTFVSLKAEIAAADLPEEVRGKAKPVAGSALTSGAGGSFPPGLTRDEIEKRYILGELKRLGGNKTQLAKSLKIGLKTLYRKLDAWGEGNGKD